jgi:hypothetical protein
MRALLVSLTVIPLLASTADDLREPVSMPAMMQAHLRANMRDHLLAISEIQAALAAGRYGPAADTAEARLGMTSLEAHGARHMAGVMPEGMRAVGTAMHRAASRFAVVAQDAEVTNDLRQALGALSDVTRQCVACHAAYRLAAGP